MEASTRIRLFSYAALSIAIIAGGLGYYSGCNKKYSEELKAVLAENDALKLEKYSHEKKVEAFETLADVASGKKVAAKTELAAAKAARLQNHGLDPLPATGRSIETIQEEVINSQDEELEAKTGVITELKSELEISEKINQNLERAVKDAPEEHPLAVGVLYGTNQTMGVWAEYDLMRVRVGADLMIHQATGTTGRSSFEAIVRVGWRW